MAEQIVTKLAEKQVKDAAYAVMQVQAIAKAILIENRNIVDVAYEQESTIIEALASQVRFLCYIALRDLQQPDMALWTPDEGERGESDEEEVQS